jgi:hypothetical protein
LAFSSWTIKPWFLIEEKFVTVLIIPSSWGSQLDGEITSTPCRIIGAKPGDLSKSFEEWMQGFRYLP